MSNKPSDYTPRPMSNRTTYALGALALVLIALIVVFAYRWGGNEQAEVRNDGYGTVRTEAVTAALQSDGGVRLGRPEAPKMIEIYEDPMCPSCGTLETLYGQEIAQKLDEGELAVHYRFVNFLDPKSSSGDYSTRAIAALQCVADTGSGVTYAKFHDALFTTRQPAEDSELTDDELLAIATESGATGPARDCITGGVRRGQVTDQAAATLDALTVALDGAAATPSVFDGTTKIDVNEPEWVQQLAP